MLVPIRPSSTPSRKGPILLLAALATTAVACAPGARAPAETDADRASLAAVVSAEGAAERLAVVPGMGGATPPSTTCAALRPVNGAVCSVTPGNGTNDALLLQGTLLTFAGAYVGADVLVQDGRTVWFGCGDALPPGAIDATWSAAPRA